MKKSRKLTPEQRLIIRLKRSIENLGIGSDEEVPGADAVDLLNEMLQWIQGYQRKSLARSATPAPDVLGALKEITEAYDFDHTAAAEEEGASEAKYHKTECSACQKIKAAHEVIALASGGRRAAKPVRRTGAKRTP